MTMETLKCGTSSAASKAFTHARIVAAKTDTEQSVIRSLTDGDYGVQPGTADTPMGWALSGTVTPDGEVLGT
jgi:hypothetical protein